jgi:hypothetical protein
VGVRCLSATDIRFSVILCPAGSWALLTVGLPANGRTPTGFPRSARMSSDRGGRPLYPGDGGAHPDRWRLTAGACRFAAASPCTRPHIPPTGISLNEASPRVQAIRPSGLPQPVAALMERAALGLTPRASHPADQEPDNARRGGDRPSSTDLELPLNSSTSISNPVAPQYVRPRVARRHRDRPGWRAPRS